MPDGLEIIFLNSVPRRTRIQRRGRSDKKSETGFSGKVSSRLRCANAGEFSEHLSERKPAFRERDARTEGNFYKSFPHERLVYEAVRRTTSSYHDAGRGNRCSENRCSRKPPFRENWGSRGRCPGKRCLQEARSQKRA